MAIPFRSNLITLLILFLFACGGNKAEQPDTTPIEYSEEVAQIINTVTSGIISPYDPIKIQFNEDMITPELRNTKIDNPFKFSPSIDGEATWTQTNQLVFTPAEPLSSRTNYTGQLDLSQINPNLSVKSIDLKFYVQGQEIQLFTGDLELLNPTDPNKLVYRGKITFAQPLDLEQLKAAATFENTELTWSKEGDKTYTFVTAPLLRQSRTSRFLFTLDREQLNLSEALERTIEVVPLSKLEVSNLEIDESGKSPKVMIKFSDQLDPNQDINGFVSVSPNVDFNLQKLGKYVILDGDFRFGNEYQISVDKGIISRWATSSEKSFEQKVQFADIAPQIEFASSGVFMPTSNNKNLQFLTTNLERVHVEVKKVFNSDIDQFFRNENIKSGAKRSNEFNNTYVSSVGAIIYNQSLEIGKEKNKWLLHNLSLDNVLTEYDNGLYLIRINFNPKDVLVPLEGEQLEYIQQFGQVYKPVTISDIGLLVKREGDEEYQVFTTDLKSGKPLPNVKVTIQRYENNYTKMTDNEGRASISASSYIQLVKAEKNGQISIIKPYEMQWNNSGFDVEGLSQYELETRAFIYTERGVYRPGDSINLSCIVRYQNKSSSDNIPAYLKLYNPEGTLVMEMTQKGAKDGFYNFNFGTNQSDPTGNWNVQVNVGNKYFYHNLKVETVVANRLKVKVTPDLKVLRPENKQLKFEVESKYLFGASADGLAYDTEVEIFDVTTAFPKFKEYSFFDQNIDFQDIKTDIRSGNLNADGKANITWEIPNMSQAPSPLKVKITATVQEDGGRPNESWTYLDLHPFSHYVGIEDNGYSYAKLNVEQKIPVVMVDTEGEAVTGKELVYRIYRNSKYWWYQYDSYRDFKLRYKTDKHSYLVEEGTITASKPFAAVPFRPTQSGQYLIEVQDASVPMGHTSSIFMSAYPFGGIPSGDENAGTLSLRSDKETYNVGEDIVITFPSPRKGNILMTVEQGDDIISSQWVEPKDQENMNLRLKATKSMAPNIYVTITVLQDHSQTINDRPIRMFGILPISVVDPDTKQELVINMPDELLPEQDFEVNVSTLSGDATQFTIAVVDEGLLDLTGFRTPNPWKEFFRKIRLDVETYDLFGHVIGANAGDVFKTFSIGGDMDYRESQLDPFEKKKRFKPVCLFKGPLLTNSNGKAKVAFKMPNYVGSVRVMVISAKGNAYGSAEKTVPVRSDLIIQPTIPRALKPGDEFVVPANVFATKENVGSVDITLTTEGPLEVIGANSVRHTFETIDDQLFEFKLRVKEAIGQGKIVITGKGANTKSTFEADVPISPSAPRKYQSEEKIIKPGETITFDLPEVGLDGTNNARLKIAVFPNMDFMHRLDYLIRYPYGCIEQTTSAVFPQLALKSLFKNDPEKQKEIDQNINAGIDRLRMFQLSDGGFSYWPGGNSASEWGSNYAGQFLIEARKKGYVVPDLMYDGIVRYLDRNKQGSKDPKYLMTRVNRCFVLALANKAPLGELNLLKQNHYNEMSNVQKWMLVAAYKLAGVEDQVKSLVTNISTTAEEYQEFGRTYGSQNRDLGIILRCLLILDRKEDAEVLAKNLAKVLSSHYWYSTQTVGQMLLGIGDYFDAMGISSGDDLIIEGLVELPNGKTSTIKSVNTYDHYINEGYGQQVKVSLNAGVKTTQLYATLSSNGVPLKDNTVEQNKNISLEVDWFNESGESIDISNVKQGSTFYGRFRVFNKSVTPSIDEVALMQILPSGWEIENTRLNGEVESNWMAGWITGKEEYLDIRDDRIMWFFDLQKTKLDFVVKINAITAGTYIMPGTRCEAMYNNDYIATKQTKTVSVTK